METLAPKTVTVRPWLLGVGFFATASATVGLTRFDGGVSVLWIATSLLLGWLATAPKELHRAGVAACCLASLMVTTLVGLGAAAAAPLVPANVGEAVVGAWLLRRWLGHARWFETSEGIAAFVVVAGFVAPAASAVPGAFMIRVVTGHAFAGSYAYWLIGHGLGTVTFTPIATLVLRGEVRPWIVERRGNLPEMLALLVAVAATTSFVFLRPGPLLLPLPMLAMMLVTLRQGRFGAASSIVVVTIAGGALTMLGYGPIHAAAHDAVAQAQFFQLYLAIAALMVLPVAALLHQHQDLLANAAHSEARYRLIERHSTDAVLNADAEGVIVYASPAFRTLIGLNPDRMIGRNALSLINPEDRAAVIEAHLTALRAPNRSVSVEYRASTTDGRVKWFESNTRAVAATAGSTAGVVSVIRDVSHRKAAELKLLEAANTDVLTGLLNRRAMLELLETRWRQVRDREGSCIIAFFDIDRFKSVNDVHGHAVGDLALQAFADVARRTLRGADVVARIGGEEFALLLWNADAGQAVTIAERIRGEVAREIIHIGAGRRLSMTVSVGLAQLVASSSPGDAMKAADQALYLAKSAGRNCVRLAS